MQFPSFLRGLIAVVEKKKSTFKIHPSIQKKRDRNQTHLKHKKNDHNRNNSPTIQRRTQHIIKLTPPSKILLPNHILEDESNKKPRTIIDPCSRWNSWESSNDDRRADIAGPWIGKTPLPEVSWHWNENSSYYGVQMGMIDGTCPELTCWTNESPRSGVVVVNKCKNSTYEPKTHQTAEAV